MLTETEVLVVEMLIVTLIVCIKTQSFVHLCISKSAQCDTRTIL